MATPPFAGKSCATAGTTELAFERERGKISRQGWGGRLLAEQDPKGAWAAGKAPDSGVYTPKWTSTTYTMLSLRDFGLPPTTPPAQKACKLLLEHGLQPDGGINYGTWAKWTRRSETCVTGMILSLCRISSTTTRDLTRWLVTSWSNRCPTADGTVDA